MNAYLAGAAVIAFLVGLVHSVLGEILIFRRLRSAGLVPSHGGDVLEERHVRILWASWHAVTVFGWCIAAVLIWLSISTQNIASRLIVERTIAFAMLVASALVLIGTKGKHPGWIGLLAVAVLSCLGSID